MQAGQACSTRQRSDRWPWVQSISELTTENEAANYLGGVPAKDVHHFLQKSKILCSLIGFDYPLEKYRLTCRPVIIYKRSCIYFQCYKLILSGTIFLKRQGERINVKAVTSETDKVRCPYVEHIGADLRILCQI